MEPFRPRDGVKIAVTDAEAKDQTSTGASDEPEDLIEDLKRKLALVPQSTPLLVPIDFEKVLLNFPPVFEV